MRIAANLDTTSSDLHLIPEEEITRLLGRVVNKLAVWVQKESIKHGRTLKIRNIKTLHRRFLKYRSGTTSAKAWLGTSPIGVDAWEDVRETDGGVFAAGEEHKGAWVNSMDSDQPLVWRRSNAANRNSPIERVTKQIDSDVTTFLLSLETGLQTRFEEMIEEEINALL